MSKKMAMGIIGGVIGIIALLVGYGFFLNYSSEKNISQQIKYGAGRHFQGMAVKQAKISFNKEFENIRLETERLEDAIAKGNGTVLEVFVKEHQQVKKGQPLLRLDGNDIRLQIAEIEENLIRLQTNVERYRLTLDRYEKLLALDAISVERRDDARANYLGAVSEARAMEQRKAKLELQLEEQLIKAPVDGEVLRIYKRPGSYVTHGTPLAMVGDFSRLYLKSFDTDEHVRAYLQGQHDDWYMTVNEENIGSAKGYRVYGAQYAENNQGSRQQFALRLESVDPPLERPAKYRNFIYSVDNSSGILEPRNYGRVRIMARGSHQGLVIPVVARHTDSEAWVYVWNEKHQLERRSIVTGPVDEDMIEVVSGLREGEIVITSAMEGVPEGTEIEVEVLEGGKG